MFIFIKSVCLPSLLTPGNLGSETSLSSSISSAAVSMTYSTSLVSSTSLSSFAIPQSLVSFSDLHLLQCMKARVKTRSRSFAFHCRYHLECTQVEHLSGVATEGQLSVYFFVFQRNCQPEWQNLPSSFMRFRNHILVAVYFFQPHSSTLQRNVGIHNLAGYCNVLAIFSCDEDGTHAMCVRRVGSFVFERTFCCRTPFPP